VADGLVGILNIFSENNTIGGNNVTDNSDLGISLSQTGYTNVSSNNLRGNGAGIASSNADSNIVSGNNVTDNVYGVVLDYGSSNIIVVGNNLIDNGGPPPNSGGLFIETYKTSAPCTIYHNNFINNSVQAFAENGGNLWDDGYPAGGNYWSDYAGVDLHSGAAQNETGADGVGDTAYAIAGYSKDVDRYPLMYPFDPQTGNLWIAVRSLMVECNGLQSDFEDLNSTYYELLNNYGALSNNDILLTEEYIALNASTYQVLQDYYGLQANYSSLQNNYGDLQTLFTALNASHTNLESNVAALNASYNNLMTSFTDYKQQTQNELADLKNTMYVFIAVTVILAAATLILAMRKPKARPET
jgi:parallel beta-helix repeat protein